MAHSKSEEPNEARERIRTNLVLARKNARVKQSDVCAFLGMTNKSISDWECGRTDCPLDTLKRLAGFYSLKGGVLWFFNPHEDPAAPVAPVVEEEPVDPEDAAAIVEAVLIAMQARSRFRKQASGGLTECEDTDIEEINSRELPPLRTPAQSAEFVLAGQKHRTKDLLGVIHSDESHNLRNLYRRA